MRIGVSGKVFAAYAALVVVFVASSALTLAYMNRASKRVVASQLLLDVQARLDGAWRPLKEFPATSTRRPDPRRALAFARASAALSQALIALDRFSETGPHLAELRSLPAHRGSVAGLSGRLSELGDHLATFESSSHENERIAFLGSLATLTAQMDRVKRIVREESQRLAERLRADEDNARTLAMILAVLGLSVAVAVALSIVRTLRPLGTLRRRAREVAGGDYRQSMRIDSNDEIGELAREFEAMAGAIQERETKLVRSERLATVGQMASHITHEIRNPLASIGLNAELLADEFEASDSEARRLAEAIAAEVDRLTAITETYLKFVRMPRAERCPEDLAALVRSVVAFSTAELNRSDIRVELSAPTDLPEVMVDESQLRQAILNLVRNAREAMAGGGVLEISLERRSENWVSIRVGDTGPGIPPADLPRIFDPFFSTKSKGTGLGLALVHQVTSAHAGRIDAFARPGGGVIFEIVLPISGRTLDPAFETRAIIEPASRQPVS